MALPRAMALSGAGACTIFSQARQENFGRTWRMILNTTGSVSSISSTSAGRRRSPPPHAGHKIIRKDAGSCAARLAILHQDLAGEEKRVPQRPRDRDRRVVEHRFQILNQAVADRQFGADHVVDRERSLECRLFQFHDGPLSPIRVIGHKVEGTVGIDRRQINSRPASMP